MLVEALSAYLAADSGCRTQLGTAATRSDRTTGIFPGAAPDGPTLVMPYVVMEQSSGQPMTISFEGTNAFQTERWRFSCCGSTYRNAKVLAKAVKFAMQALRGTQAGSAFVYAAWQRLEADDAEPITRGTLWMTHVDFDVHYTDGDTA